MTPASSAATGGLIWRELGLDHVDAIYDLHRACIGESVRPEIVKPESRDFFVGILSGRGRIISVWDGPALIAYGVLQRQLPAYDDPRPHIGAAADAPVAKLAGASVEISRRGAGLQRALIAARVAMADPGQILFATSAPANTPSWSNLLAEGFQIRALLPYYGGHLRYVMVRDGTRLAPKAERLMAPSDHEGQIALLRAGWRGVETGDTGTGPHILYVSDAGDE